MMWWFTRTEKSQRIVVVVDDVLSHKHGGSALNFVQSANALPDGRIQVSLDDGSAMNLAIGEFNRTEGNLTHTLNTDLNALQFVQLLLTEFAKFLPVQENGNKKDSSSEDSSSGRWKRHLLIGAVAAPAALATAVVALPVIGFGAGGIAAGSWAAGMMSSAAAASGGGVAAGSLVAVLQSAGAAGLGLLGGAAVGGAGAATGIAASAAVGAAQDILNKKKDDDKGDGNDDDQPKKDSKKP